MGPIEDIFAAENSPSPLGSGLRFSFPSPSPLSSLENSWFLSSSQFPKRRRRYKISQVRTRAFLSRRFQFCTWYSQTVGRGSLTYGRAGRGICNSELGTGFNASLNNITLDAFTNEEGCLTLSDGFDRTLLNHNSQIEFSELIMTALDATRAELALLVLYLNKAEARDKICRAIQYGSKFLSNGEPGIAQNVDKTTSLARKVFRLLKFVNDLHALISPPPQGTPLPLILLGKSKNALVSTFLLLDQVVWAGRTGIYKNKERAELIGRISLFCWMGSSACTTLIELAELQRLAVSMKKLEKDLKVTDKNKNEQYLSKLKQSNDRLLALIKASMDIVVAVGLLQLAPDKVTPRVTGGFGFLSSLISCYQLLPSPPKAKAP